MFFNLGIIGIVDRIAEMPINKGIETVLKVFISIPITRILRIVT